MHHKRQGAARDVYLEKKAFKAPRGREPVCYPADLVCIGLPSNGELWKTLCLCFSLFVVARDSGNGDANRFQLFTSFFKTLVGKDVTVELKNDLR
jgi:hypothetical protein